MYIISLGGSIVVPKKVDSAYLKNLKQFLEKRVNAGDNFVVIVGGGQITRDYQKKAKEVSPEVSSEALDWLGIEATKLNAVLLRTVLQSELKVRPEILTNYKEGKPDGDYDIYLASGYVPGHSTDFDAIMWAQVFEAGTVLNFTDVDYVYDKNPKEHDDAEPIEKLTWEDYGQMFGFQWQPGLNSPFDPVAAKEAKKGELEVAVLNGRNLQNVESYLAGDDFKGTVISG